MTDGLTRWEQLEEFLFDHNLNGTAFTNEDVAAYFGLTNRQATYWIHDYQRAQRSAKVNTLFVIRREGRTTSAIWFAGVKTIDARKLTAQTVDDIRTRLHDAIQPTLESIESHNPKAKPACDAIWQGLDAGLQLLSILS